MFVAVWKDNKCIKDIAECESRAVWGRGLIRGCVLGCSSEEHIKLYPCQNG